jgi:hypothetical protein
MSTDVLPSAIGSRPILSRRFRFSTALWHIVTAEHEIYVHYFCFLQIEKENTTFVHRSMVRDKAYHWTKLVTLPCLP